MGGTTGSRLLGRGCKRSVATGLSLLLLCQSCVGARAAGSGRGLFSLGSKPKSSGFHGPGGNAAAVSSRSTTEGESQKWDTQVFLRAFVDAQRTQLREEVQRVRSFIPFIPPGLVAVNRKPEDIARDTGKLAADVMIGYAQSAALGYVFGFGGALMADKAKKATMARLLKGRYPHMKGIKQAKQFGEFCAAFTFFEGLLLVGRGVNDKWNGILGSAATGMFTARTKRLPVMLQNGLTFGGFNYLLTSFGGMGEKGASQKVAEETGGKDGKKAKRVDGDLMGNPKAKSLLRNPPKAKDRKPGSKSEPWLY